MYTMTVKMMPPLKYVVQFEIYFAVFDNIIITTYRINYNAFVS